VTGNGSGVLLANQKEWGGDAEWRCTVDLDRSSSLLNPNKGYRTEAAGLNSLKSAGPGLYLLEGAEEEDAALIVHAVQQELGNSDHILFSHLLAVARGQRGYQERGHRGRREGC
jgi:hypothetical protein